MSVYFARVRGYVKIGYSAKPESRVGTITTGTCLKPEDVTYGDSIDLYGWIPGDRKAERAIHRRFASLHVMGEWFWDDDAYDELIEADPLGVPLHTLPAQVVFLMAEYPTIPRAQVVSIFAADRAERLADPVSDASHGGHIFGPDFAKDIMTRAAESRAADRAFWRSRRAAA